MYTLAFLFTFSVMEPPLAAETPGWQTHYDAAQELGRQGRKPLAIFLGSGSAGWNQLLPEGRLGKEAGRILVANYTCLYVDLNQEEGTQLAAALDLKAGPGLVISDPTGELQAFHHEGKLGNDTLTRLLRKYADRQHVVRTTEVLPAAPQEVAAPSRQADALAQQYVHATASADAAADSALTGLACQEWINTQPLKLEALRGKVVLLDFWATWCGHCVAELPEVQRAHELYRERGLVVIGVHHNSVSADEVRAFVQSRGLSYAIALDDPYGATCGSFNVTRFPTIVLIDRHGRIVPGAHRGPEMMESVRRVVLQSEDRN